MTYDTENTNNQKGKMVRKEGHMETEHDLQQPQNSFNRAQATDEETGMDAAQGPEIVGFMETDQAQSRADDSALGYSTDTSASSQEPNMEHVYQPTTEDYTRCMALTIISIAAYMYMCVRRRVEIPWQPPNGNNDNEVENFAINYDNASQEETGYWSLDEDFNPFDEE
ncbi:uncharacterized protein LOC124110428 isoform X2 [Haliotis rufescens]|uniref:uncharacterized protein LOC124110428 isoform X2 n=1 Tax=Haliotis rufescens TaxID=6454 RepID=UPI001EAFF87D|nr:uncharacterized protein LOC124110428 isoform X2 [Haliotis rufescens]